MLVFRDDGAVHRESHQCGVWKSYWHVTYDDSSSSSWTHNSNSGLGPVLIAVGFVRRISSLEPGVLECCATDDKHAMVPFSLGLSLQPKTAPLSGSC